MKMIVNVKKRKPVNGLSIKVVRKEGAWSNDVNCGQGRGKGLCRHVQASTLFINAVCFADTLYGWCLSINFRLLFILYDFCHRILYGLALIIGLLRCGSQGEVVYSLCFKLHGAMISTKSIFWETSYYASSSAVSNAKCRCSQRGKPHVDKSRQGGRKTDIFVIVYGQPQGCQWSFCT